MFSVDSEWEKPKSPFSLSDLNPEQQAGVTQTDSYVLVLAGAGSGKTRILTYKVAYLIEALHIKPWEILAVTFTNKAANEMQSRIFALIGAKAKKVWMGTFHSFCARVLRQYGTLLGYNPQYTIYDTDDSKSLIKRILKEKELSIHISPGDIAKIISNSKNEFILPADYKINSFRDPYIKSVYTTYQDVLKSNNAMDFDDLLINTHEVFRKSKEALNRFSFRYILVDEYQDTNRVQYELLKQLSALHKNLTVVGDEDQSIYGFRGANIHNILNFKKDFGTGLPEKVHIIRLEENYRSTKNILKAASSVVSNNKLRLGKILHTRNPVGEQISLFVAETPEQEASEIVAKIEELGSPLNNFVILYRTNAQSRVIEEALRLRNKPYIIVGGIRFYERKEIKDILAYLKILINPSDNQALRRIINIPHRGIGQSTLELLVKFAEAHRTSVYSAIGKIELLKELSETRKKRLLKFLNYIESLKQKKYKPAVLIKNIMEETGYAIELKDEGEIEAETRLQNLQELIRGAEPYHSLEEYLENISLFTDIDNWDSCEQKVTLMTVHNAKGLEFNVVFVAGLEEGLFPHQLSFGSEFELEEERRLFHVALTRAKEKVFLSYSNERKRYVWARDDFKDIRGELTEPSSFLNEIPEECLKKYSRTF